MIKFAPEYKIEGKSLMERHFEQQIDKLKIRLIKMCSLVDEQVEFAIRSIEEGNTELANLVLERDKKVDKYDVKVEKICQKLIALTQPVAMDLRLIMSALTINNNLERMGDIAVNIAQNAEKFKEKPEFLKEIQFKEISVLAQEMVHTAIDSFIDNNAELALKVLKTDDSLDELVRINDSHLIEIMKKNPDDIELAIKVYSMLYQLERLGDHSTNIAEDVYFIVEAQMIKHRYEEFLFNVEKPDEDETD